MASSLQQVTYIVDQLQPAGCISYKKMFGEYGIYCDGIYFACVCDNNFYVKITPGVQALLPMAVTQPPYPGAKPMFLIEQLEDLPLLTKITQLTCGFLATGKTKK